MDFVNAPIGKGLPISQSLHPLIAVPTTAGTGSETTGTAILDITSRSFKTGIANRAMKPALGIVVSLTLIEADFLSPFIGYSQYGDLPDCSSHQRRS
jgi:alcohol dehydrogenase class IV